MVAMASRALLAAAVVVAATSPFHAPDSPPGCEAGQGSEVSSDADSETRVHTGRGASRTRVVCRLLPLHTGPARRLGRSMPTARPTVRRRGIAAFCCCTFTRDRHHAPRRFRRTVRFRPAAAPRGALLRPARVHATTPRKSGSFGLPPRVCPNVCPRRGRQRKSREAAAEQTQLGERPQMPVVFWLTA